MLGVMAPKSDYVGAGLILITRDLQVLLVKDANSDKWGFPKGHREPIDVNDIATACREVAEETGIQAGDYSIVPAPFRIMRGTSTYIFRYAVMRDMHTVGSLTAPNEVSELRWVSIVDILIDGDFFGDRLGNKYLRTWIQDLREAGCDPQNSPKKTVAVLFKCIYELLGAEARLLCSHFKYPCVRVTS